MKLRNTTDIPNETVKEIIRFVRPSGIANFDVMLKNMGRDYGAGFSGTAYHRGSSYHATAAAFVTVNVSRERREGGRANFPCLYHPYQYGQLKERRYYLANRTEALVVGLSHELRHLWQHKTGEKRRGMAFGARGKASEIDTESYAIRMLRAWRKHVRDLGAGVIIVPNVTPRLPDSEADKEAKRIEAAAAKLTKLIANTQASLKRWNTKAKRAATAIKKLNRTLKRLQKRQVELARKEQI